MERNPRWCIVASTIITAPSTIKPKSIAPRLIRFPDTPKVYMSATAKSIASGITEATISPARRLPRKSTSTTITISAPSIRFFSTVPMVRPTSSLRSRNASISSPSGNVFSICCIRSFTRFTTAFEFSPFSIKTMAPTTSPSWL